jgi:hypothetical protein
MIAMSGKFYNKGDIVKTTQNCVSRESKLILRYLIKPGTPLLNGLMKWQVI